MNMENEVQVGGSDVDLHRIEEIALTSACNNNIYDINRLQFVCQNVGILSQNKRSSTVSQRRRRVVCRYLPSSAAKQL